MPLRLANDSDLADATSKLMRTIFAQDHLRCLNTLVTSITHLMDECSSVWQAPRCLDQWHALKYSEPSPELNSHLKRLKDMAARISLLGDAIAGESLAQQARFTTSVIKALGATSGTDFVLNLGFLLRTCSYENGSYESARSEPPRSKRVIDPSGITRADVESPTLTKNASEVQPKAIVAKLMATRLKVVITKFFECKGK